MTCEECLTTVTTASLQEVVSDPRIRQHSEECQDCSRVLTLVTSGERDLATLLAQQSPKRAVSATVETAISRAKRQRLGIGVSVFLAALLAASLWVAWVRLVVPTARATAEMTSNHQQTETLELNCLSPAEAGTLISPYVRANGSLYYLPAGALRVITVRATPEEMRKVKSLLGRWDSKPSGSCDSRSPVRPP
jgi:hypothetical protein